MIGLAALRAGLREIRPSMLRLRAARCPFCGPTLIVRLRDDETAVRCLRCGASAVHLSIGWALRTVALEQARGDVYELSSRGALVAWLAARSRSLALSEFFDGVAPGAMHGGVRCEDVQRLSFAEASFDLVTHTEVLEHVADDAAALRELHRVLRPGGVMVFTVPLQGGPSIERARLRDGRLEHLLPPTYHGDRLRGAGAVLCFRDYGCDDIVARVAAAGFDDATLMPPDARVPWDYGRGVVTARKPQR